MPLKRTDIHSIDELNGHINHFSFDDSTVFITITLKPFLYKESFKNQYEKTQKELKQFLECVIQGQCIVTTESTKQNNVHYHIIAKSEHETATIDDFVKNFQRLGNTLSRKHNAKLQSLDDTRLKLQEYVQKDYDRTDNLLNALYKNDYSPVAFKYEVFEKKKKLDKTIIKRMKPLDKGINEFDDDIFLPTPNHIINKTTKKVFTKSHGTPPREWEGDKTR